MHHSESTGDSAGIRKMAHPAIFPRRGSNTGSSSASALTTAANASVSNNIIPNDDYQSPLVIQPPPPAGSSSPGPQHHPQSLNLLSQSQLHSQTLQVGAQIKKKSGFQITSVTPAQISVSTNNSITEDTESCDDLDESHTEDLSSSEILDVSQSLSRATDMGGAERSSSEETLNNFHEADTPGALSPNQPPHPLSHGTQHGPMVNGTANHHPHQQHSHIHHPNLGHRHQVPHSQPTSGLPVGGGVSVAGTSTLGALSGVAPKFQTGLVAAAVNPHTNKPAALAQPVATSSSGTGTLSMPAAAAVNMVNPSISKVSDVNMLRSTGRGPSAGPQNAKSISAAMDSSGLGVNSMQQQSAVQPVAMTTASVAPPGVVRPGSGGVAPSPAAMTPAPPQQVPAPTSAPNPPPASTSSRFRVVKLDSNSEPFKKGRWTCAEYYEKEAPPPADGLRSGQLAAEGMCEREGPVATPGHHGDTAEAQQAFQQPPPGVQNQLLGAPWPHTVQDPGLLKSAAAQSVPTVPGVALHQQAAVNQGGQQTAPAPQHQMAYALAGQSAQAGYVPSAQQPPAPAQAMATVQPGVRVPQPHPPGHLAAGAVPPPVSGQPAVSMPSATAQTLPQGLQQPAPQAQAIPPQASSATQPRPTPVPVPSEQLLPPRTQYPGSQPPLPAASSTPIGLLLERKPSPAQAPPAFTSTQLEDFLFQHHSLLSLPKLGAGECASGAPGLEDGGGTSALPAGAGLFPLKSLPMDGEEDSSSGASVVAIDNKIEQAMDLVKSHLMYAVREEVEVLKEQIKELIERNSQLEQENNLLKNLASPEQLAQFQAQVQSGSPPPSAVPAGPGAQPQPAAPPAQTAPQNAGLSA
ncbi:TSC22 domain family protein 1 isoform X1 [Conger conger]|uniref:TSC22 domain family protein 1 isoform X1 n=1 Tax=Conger conger TaxID=82655 RepID=UPI002A5A5851|nr:TSC22 domain family protein 1 isoform X1 [Conger conger]